MVKGWYRQGWRHSLAAKGISTYRTINYSSASRMSFARKPLITNDEISAIENSTGKKIGEFSDQELSGMVGQLRSSQQTEKFKPKQIAPKVENKEKIDYLEPFRSPEEKSDIGKEMAERVIADKVSEIDSYMSQHNIDFEDKRRIMDHYVNPLAEKLRKGHMTEKEFNDMVDDKVKYNTGMSRKDSLGAFEWAKEKPLFDWKKPEKPKDDGGPGALNFIDRAKAERGPDASEPSN